MTIPIGSEIPSQPLPKESIETNRLLAIVLTALAIGVISGGAYLLLSGIGTIPSVITGSTLIVTGVSSIVWSVFSLLCQPKQRQAITADLIQYQSS